MKVNIKDTDSLFEKSFAKYPCNSEKKTSIPDRFKKSFSFLIYSSLFKKADEVLAFSISKGFNSLWLVFQGAVNNFSILFCARIIGIVFYTYNSKTCLTVLLARKLLWSAIKLEFARFL